MTVLRLLAGEGGTVLANHQPEEIAMPLNPKDSLDAVRDVAVHSIEKASDIVDNAADIIRGEVAEGISGIVQNSVDIGRHVVDKLKEVVTGDGVDTDAEA
jgi:hypothetical protein